MTPLMIFWVLVPVGISLLVVAAMSGTKPVAKVVADDPDILEEAPIEPTPVSDIHEPAAQHTFAEAPSVEPQRSKDIENYVPASPYIRELIAQSKANTSQDPRWRM